MLKVLFLMQLAVGSGGLCNSAGEESVHVNSSETALVLHGRVSFLSLEQLFRQEDPSLLWRCDVNDFITAKNPKLRSELLKALYKNGCIDWKFLGKLSSAIRKGSNCSPSLVEAFAPQE